LRKNDGADVKKTGRMGFAHPPWLPRQSRGAVIDGLVRDVEQTEQTVKEMESILDLATPEAATTFDPLSTPKSSGGGPTPNRVRR
jgi:hypothetical protein